MVDHAEWFLFAWVFANQAGVPLPVVPALLGAGVLAGSGYLSMAAIIGIAVGASLAADLTWYGLGRWRGARAVKMLGRVAPNAGTVVSRARSVFFAHAAAFQLAARFLPELNAIASGLAGVTRVSTMRFVCYGAVSGLIWAGGWTGLGYLLSQAVTETAARLGVRLIVFFLTPFGLYLLFHRVRRHRLIRVFRQARLRPDDLEAALGNSTRMEKEDAEASQTVDVPFQSWSLDRSSGAPPDLIDMAEDGHTHEGGEGRIYDHTRSVSGRRQGDPLSDSTASRRYEWISTRFPASADGVPKLTMDESLRPPSKIAEECP
jgi:membrane protein DedA with SNARE-associated domain